MKIYNNIIIPKGLSPEVCECREEYLSGYTAGYTSGVTDGIEEGKEEQKSLMVYTAITENGTYSREDGYNEIFVDVPSYSAETYASGYTDGYESGYTDGSEDGFDSGYTSGYTDGTEDGFDSGYTSGYTDGSEDGYGSGYTSGYTDGTEDGYGSGYTSGYTDGSEDGFDSGYTSGYTDGYESGYTDGTEDGYGSGYTSGKTDGYESGYTQGTEDGFDSGYTSGYTDGYGSGYTSGYTDGSEDGFESGYTSGKTDGVAEQKAKLVATAVTSNGTYSREDGFSSVSVNVPSGHTDEEIAEAFSSGKTAGVDEQKAKLVATAFTANGTYSREDGFSSVYVNVPQTGQTINNQTKNVNISQNGSSTVTHDSNYTGLEYVTINVNVPQTGHTDQEMAEAYASGITHQKSLLAATAFTGNGTFTRTDGWNSVTVNVSGYTQEDLDNAFRSGYTSGWTDGYGSGWTDGYASGYTDGWNDASGGTQSAATELSIVVPSAITGTGRATVEYQPSTAILDLVFTSSDPDIATVANNGRINVISAGTVNICVEDRNSGLYDCETVTVVPQEGLYEPLTVNVLSAGTILWLNKYDTVKTIEYQKNGGEWTSITSTTAGTPISVVAGDVVKLRGNNSTYASTNSTFNEILMQTGKYQVKGNIMSLIDSTNYAEITSFNTGSTYAFCELFSNGLGIVDASKLLLPATTLAEACYLGMFSGCTNLVSAPELPATTLASNCYASMFQGCTSLTTAPELPATTATNYCYGYMFQGCTGLTAAPELPATTLADYCYTEMFKNCISLTTAPVLPSIYPASNCYREMFYGCTSLTTAPVLPATTLAERCYRSMFQGCTSLTTTPALPATILANGCYDHMFQGCTSIVTAPSILPSTALTQECYSYMFANCTSLTTAPELPAAVIATRSCQSMFVGCTNLNYVKSLAITGIGTNTSMWLSGVASSGTFVKDPNATWTTGISGIPNNWTVIDAS